MMCFTHTQIEIPTHNYTRSHTHTHAHTHSTVGHAIVVSEQTVVLQWNIDEGFKLIRQTAVDTVYNMLSLC